LGMLTAYAAYKAKLAKATTPRQKASTKNPAASLEWIEKTAAKLGSIDNAAWTDDEKEAFRAALVGLQNAIDA